MREVATLVIGPRQTTATITDPDLPAAVFVGNSTPAVEDWLRAEVGAYRLREDGYDGDGMRFRVLISGISYWQHWAAGHMQEPPLFYDPVRGWQ